MNEIPKKTPRKLNFFDFQIVGLSNNHQGIASKGDAKRKYNKQVFLMESGKIKFHWIVSFLLSVFSILQHSHKDSNSIGMQRFKTTQTN